MGLIDNAKEKLSNFASSFQKNDTNNENAQNDVKEDQQESEISAKSKTQEEKRKMREQELNEKLNQEKEEILDLPMYSEIKWDSTKDLDKDNSTKMVKILQKTPLFRDFSERQLKKFIPYFYMRHFTPGEYLFKKGNPGSCMYIINTGKVYIQETLSDNQPPIVYAKLSDGGMFGEMSLTGSRTRSTDAVSMSESDVYVLFRYDLEDFFKREQGLGWKFYTKINAETSERLNKTNNDLLTEKIENQKMREYIENIYAQAKEKGSNEGIKLAPLSDVLTKWYGNTK